MHRTAIKPKDKVDFDIETVYDIIYYYYYRTWNEITSRMCDDDAVDDYIGNI